TGVIRTLLGTGPAGYGGDGGPGSGVRITATVPAGGFTSNDAQADVRQSTFHVFVSPTTLSGLSGTFSVGAEPAGLGCCYRVAGSVHLDVAPSDPTVLAPTTPVTIADNGTSTGNQPFLTVGAGVSALVASTVEAPINAGVSPTVTVVPTLTSIVPSAGQAGSVVTATLNGTNLVNASGITVSGTGVSVSVTSRSNTALTIALTLDPLAEAGARTVTVITPGGNATIGFVVASAPITSLRLTDINQFLANSSGAATFGFYHNTNVDSTAYQLGVTTPAIALPTASPVAFINPGQEDIDLPLTLGTNSFTMVADQTTSDSPFGLNLFFNDQIIPAITVDNANGGSGPFSIQPPETNTAGVATGGNTSVPASGVSSYVTGDGYAATLTSYGVRSTATPFVDLAAGFVIGASNGTADTVSSFTLEVTQPGNMQAFASLGAGVPSGFAALAPGRTTINFDENPLPDGSANGPLGGGVRGTQITTQYAPLGVSFGAAAGGIASYVYGAFNAAFTGKSLGNDAFSFQGPVAATFTLAETAVGVVVRDGDAGVGAATLTAYSGPSGTGIALGSASSPGGTGNDPYFLGLVDTSATPRIRSVIVRFQRVSGSDLTVDDFTFVRSSP
ncbi:MAG TPA: hypothetical protein VFT43_02120, partial [Candidatus Polarisedimenticolia bacterium]|nr:hypothetical protein [Candidatus Polarisedimenticolia bacterium]